MFIARKAQLLSPFGTSDRRSAKERRLAVRQQLQALDTVSTAVMIVGRKFVVQHVNRATRELLTQHRNAFRKIWPNVEPGRILGMCIDSFHRDPSQRRRMLADPSRLTHRTDIAVGGLQFALTVNAATDEDRAYTGDILEWQDITVLRIQQGQLAAIDRSQAVITFDLHGRILDATASFLATFGYSREEIRGQHHSLFVTPEEKGSVGYRAFWEKLGRGEYDVGRYRRIGNRGREGWMQAGHNPVPSQNGKPLSVVKDATDITAQVMAAQALDLVVAQTECIVGAARGNDLSQRIPMDGKVGDIGALCGSINGLLDTLAGAVASIMESCVSLASAAQEIAGGNTDWSQRTEETAASLEELTGTVKQNADNARQAAKLAASATDVALRGGTVVSEVVRTMEAITQSSRKISDIIGVIDEIAFQANILALNAAVEALPAGEQGRGFAVVAAEVRSLAQRSANAAKEIKALVSDSVDKVEDGSRLLGTAGTTMEEIVGSVQRVTDIMAEIAAAAKSMEEQTEALAGMVSGFVLPESMRGANQSPPPPACRPAAAVPATHQATTAARRRPAAIRRRTPRHGRQF